VTMELGGRDSSGRRKPVKVAGSEHDLPCDYVVFAIGQELETKLMEDNNIELATSGFIQVDPLSLQTSQEGVFAGGDAVSGPASAVEAIAAGHQAAISIDRFLNNEDLKAGREKLKQQKADIPKEALRLPLAREQPSTAPLDERVKGFIEVDQGYTK